MADYEKLDNPDTNASRFDAALAISEYNRHETWGRIDVALANRFFDLTQKPLDPLKFATRALTSCFIVLASHHVEITEDIERHFVPEERLGSIREAIETASITQREGL